MTLNVSDLESIVVEAGTRPDAVKDPEVRRAIEETIDPEVFSSLSTRAGGEVIGADQF